MQYLSRRLMHPTLHTVAMATALVFLASQVGASAFCVNSRKRLPTNAEWQVAALAHGVNADANCNTTSGTRAATGTYGACVSEAGAYATTGNLWERVADWVTMSNDTEAGWEFGFVNDWMCLKGADASSPGPGALLRGGILVKHQCDGACFFVARGQCVLASHP